MKSNTTSFLIRLLIALGVFLIRDFYRSFLAVADSELSRAARTKSKRCAAETHISAIVQMPPRKASLINYSERVALLVLSKLTGVSAAVEANKAPELRCRGSQKATR